MKRQLKPISEGRFLELSAGIPDYNGPDLEKRRASLAAGYLAINSGIETIPDSELDAEVQRRIR